MILLYKIVAVGIEEQLALSRAECVGHKTQLDNIPSQVYRVRVERLSVPENGRIYRFPFTYVNPKQVETVGIFSSAEEMIGKTDFECFKYESALSAYNDYVQIVEAVQNAINNKIQIVETDLGIHKEEIFTDKLGRTHIFRVCKIPVIKDGIVVAINGNSTDITHERELENTEKKLMATIEAERTEYKKNFFLSPSPMVQVAVDTDLITNVNKMYHIVNDYCVEIKNIAFTNQEIQTINNSFGMHYFEEDQRLCLTALIEENTPEYNLLIGKNNPEINSGLQLVKTEEYKLMGKPVDILNAFPYDKRKKEKYIRDCETKNPNTTKDWHRTRTGRHRLMEVQAHITHTGQKAFYEGVDKDITEQYFAAKELNNKVLELDEANKKLEELALTDALTGIATRRALDINAIFTLNGAKRENAPPEHIGFIFMDLDRFKFINDTYGHDVGDQALVEFAKRLKNVGFRESDLISRYGGDEFVVMVTGLKNPEEILTISSRIRPAIETEPLRISETNSIFLGISIGCSVYLPEKYQEETTQILYKKLIADADHEMYMDKARRKEQRR